MRRLICLLALFSILSSTSTWTFAQQTTNSAQPITANEAASQPGTGALHASHRIVIDGVTYPYTAAGVNAAVHAAVALTSGGVVDATGIPTETFSSEIDVGDATGSDSVTLLVPPVGTWTFTMRDGASCGLRVYGKSSVIGSNPSGSTLFTVSAGAAANLRAVVCNDPTDGQYVRIEGFGVSKPVTATVTCGVMCITGSADGTLIHSVKIGPGGGIGLQVAGVCCGAVLSDLVIDGGSLSGSRPLVIGTGSSPATAVFEISCMNCSVGHPGPGLNAISFGANINTENVNFYNLYLEPNISDTTTPLIQVPAGVAGINIWGAMLANSARGSSAYMVDIAKWAGPCDCTFEGLKSQTKHLINDHITGQTVISTERYGQSANYFSGRQPVILSGFGTNSSIEAANGMSAFAIRVGTGGNATSGVLGLPLATHGWYCAATDVTHPTTGGGFLVKETDSSQQSVTLTGYDPGGTATPWTPGDLLNVSCSSL